MNKTAAGLGVLGLGATASVAAPLAMTLNGGTSGEVTEGGNVSPSSKLVSESISRPNWKGTRVPLTSSSDVKTKYLNVDCLKEHLKSGQSWNDESDNYTNQEANFSFLGKDDDEPKSCLIVEYYKQKQKTEKMMIIEDSIQK